MSTGTAVQHRAATSKSVMTHIQQFLLESSDALTADRRMIALILSLNVLAYVQLKFRWSLGFLNDLKSPETQRIQWFKVFLCGLICGFYIRATKELAVWVWLNLNTEHMTLTLLPIFWVLLHIKSILSTLNHKRNAVWQLIRPE